MEIYQRLAEIHLEKFANQARARAAYEKVIGADPGHERAYLFLKDLYEKRREQEKLDGLNDGWRKEK